MSPEYEYSNIQLLIEGKNAMGVEKRRGEEHEKDMKRKEDVRTTRQPTNKPFHTEGPQFSTRAESNMYRAWGGSVINMSVLPEAKLAKEAEIAYQMICMSTDYDCWHDSADVTVEMVMANMKANSENARHFIGGVLDEITKEEHRQLVEAKHLEGQTKFAGGITAPAGRSEGAKEKLQWLFPGYFE